MSFSFASVLRITNDFMFPLKVFEKYEIDVIKKRREKQTKLK
jgi:hypothetical protein